MAYVSRFAAFIAVLYCCLAVVSIGRAVVVAAADGDADSALVPEVSFRTPFSNVDADGARQVDNFLYGGSVVVNEHFIRMTPDRASKRGWMWSRNKLDLDQWTMTVRFRVSGQGKRLFGDGFALWFTQHQYHVDGPVHGFAENYVGFGVLFDTFVNTESSHKHKDVSLFINNGVSKDADTADSEAEQNPGCDGDFRYWEGRADFSVASKSTVKITYNAGKVSVALDARNTGDFATCIQEAPLDLPADWHKSMYVGVTATTGQLADNHDILSVLVSRQPDLVMPEHPIDEVATLTTGNPQIDAVVNAAVTRELKTVSEKLQHLHHHLEHQLASVHDSLQHNVKKLQEQEQESVRRIAALEDRLRAQLEVTVEDTVTATVDLTLEERLIAVESALNMAVDAKVQEIGPKMEQQIDDKVTASGRGWILPFIFLFFLLSAASGFAVMKWRQAMKSHLL